MTSMNYGWCVKLTIISFKRYNLSYTNQMLPSTIYEDTMIPPPSTPLWQALVAEFVGTFALVFIGAGAAALT